MHGGTFVKDMFEIDKKEKQSLKEYSYQFVVRFTYVF